MQLVKLGIRNFRAIGSGAAGTGVTLDLEDHNLILLVGKNNSGKSAILHAYEMFVTAEKTAVDEEFFNCDTANRIEIEAWFRAQTEEDRGHQAISNWIDASDVVRFRKTWSEVGAKAQVQSRNPATGEWNLGGAGGMPPILQNACPTPVWIRCFMSPEDVVAELQALAKQTILKKVMQTEAWQLAQDAISALQTEAGQDAYVGQVETRLNNVIAEIFPELKCKLSTVTGTKQDFTDLLAKGTNVRIAETNRPELPLALTGAGTRRQLILSARRSLHEKLVLAKKTGKKSPEDFAFPDAVPPGASKSQMLLFEEPELFLHPQAIRRVKEMVYELAASSEFQVLAATHSPIMVDLGKPQTTLVRVVSRVADGSVVYQVPRDLFGDQEREHMRMLNEFDPYVCEAFFADRVVLAEGDTEVTAIRTLLHRLLEELPNPEGGLVHVVNCGGKPNIPFFLKVLRHFRIESFVFHDRDRRETDNGNVNPAYTLNTSIWEEIQRSNQAGVRTRRFVFNRDFENAHGYAHDPAVGKPYSAFKMALQWGLDDPALPVITFLRVVLGVHQFDERFTPETLAAMAD